MASTEEEENNRQPPWSQLLPELVSMICQRLCPSDVPRFGAVCKRWHNCAYPVYPADSTPILISNTISDTGLIRCYSPYFNKMFIVRTPLRAPESRIFSASADGRVILRRPDKTILFGSLLDGSAFETTESKYDGGYFWTSIGDGNGHPEQCGILGFCPSMHKVRVQSWNGERWKYFGYSSDEDDSSSDEDDSSSDSSSGSNSDSNSDWDEVEDSDDEVEDEAMEIEKGYTDSDSGDNNGEDADKGGEEEEIAEEETEDVEMEEQDSDLRLFTMSCSNPVLHKGLLYFLGEGGSLGVYDPNTTNWSILSRPTRFGYEFPHKNCYLVESSQELLAVLTGRDGKPINVLKLKEEEMMWERVDSLGSTAIFTGTIASLSMAQPPKAMANKVYLPKFYGHPQIIPANLITCRGRLFFVPERKEMQQPSSNKAVYNFMREQDTSGDKDGAWCYDLELDSGVDKETAGCKNMLQYIWVHLGRAAP